VRVNPDTFDEQYRDAPGGDPWSFASSAYEQRRYDLTVGCLDRARYGRAFEPGCAVGELTWRLADRCDEVVAIDPSATALAQAERRCADLAHVHLSRGAVPEAWPPGRFDLVVLSEIGYYFDPAELTDLVARTLASLAPAGQVLATHWRGHSDDHVLHGDTVHRILEDVMGSPTVRLEDPGFLCARWDRS
jgi:SAM-dependent methyltransferase